MATIKRTSVPTKRLASSITAASSTIQLTDIQGWDGNDLTSSDFGTKLYAVLRNDSGTLMELIELDPTTIADSSITVNKRGLKFTGDLTTEVTANKLTWVKNETQVELGSNPPQLLKHFLTILGGQTLLALIDYDTGITPLADQDLATKKYVDDNVNGGTVSHNKIVVAGNAGETVAAGELVYMDDTDDEWKLCDADTAATVDNVMLGIAQGAGTNGNTIAGGVLIWGLDTNQTGLTAGDIMYASNTAGAIANSAGTTERAIGKVAPGSTTDLYFDPYFYNHITADQKDALAGSSGTPSTSNKYVTQDDPSFSGIAVGVKTLTAGATINGATLPVPVYQSKSDNEIYACDANDTSAYKFIGFAITNGTDGNDIDVQFNGIISGFTGLSEGEKYYVQDAVGTIGTTQGTQKILVGVAISETELIIQKGRRLASGAASITGTATSAITLGFRPDKILILASGGDNSQAQGYWEANGGERCIYSFGLQDASSDQKIGTDTDDAWHIVIANSGGAETQNNTGNITSVTDTGFTLSQTKSGGSDVAVTVYWLAEGDL